jgi:ATP-dependent 26S proteasome regulatory subunit
MCHGKQGTGKTTTILAIASYLGLDIYYVDLNGVKTNSELKMLFNYVRDQNLTNGMIVFEDIDAMTKIVHKRRADELSETLSDLGEGELSLSYLLNSLDGNLCGDNTVFAMTTNHKEMLDPALYRRGRIDVDIEFKCCDHYQFQSIYKRIFKREIPMELLSRIEENVHTPAEVIFTVVKYLFQEGATDETILSSFSEH